MTRLEIRDVSKRFDDLWALRDVTFGVERGVLGLLGPNGAGKSTLMRILATISDPTDGEVRWDGVALARNPDRLRRVLGYLPQDFGIYPRLTAAEFLGYLAAAKGVAAGDRVGELLELVHLREAADRRLESFSGGMRQRVGIAQALLNDPELLIVDEPTVGLDPAERARFRNLLSELASDRIVILSTHIVSDVEATAERIVLLDQGRIRADGPPGELTGAAEGNTWSMVVEPERLASLRREHRVSAAVFRPDGAHVRLLSEEPPAPDARAVTPTLEDAYLWLTGRERGVA